MPIFNVKVDNVMIWTRDNRNESEHVSEEISLITGLKHTLPSYNLSKDVLEKSLMASVSQTAMNSNDESRIRNEIQQSLSHDAEDWSRTSGKILTAPAGKNCRVRQLTCDFSNPQVSNDKWVLKCDYINHEETSGELY